MAKTLWKRDLGTSKREQGIVTPKAPQNRPRPKLRTVRQQPISIFSRVLLSFKNLGNTIKKQTFGRPRKKAQMNVPQPMAKPFLHRVHRAQRSN